VGAVAISTDSGEIPWAEIREGNSASDKFYRRNLSASSNPLI
jgi:hypothetical protein